MVGECCIVIVGGGKPDWYFLWMNLHYWLTDRSLMIVLGFSTGFDISNGDRSTLKPSLRKDPNLVYLPDPETRRREYISRETLPGTCVHKLAVRPLYLRICPWEDLVSSKHLTVVLFHNVEQRRSLLALVDQQPEGAICTTCVHCRTTLSPALDAPENTRPFIGAPYTSQHSPSLYSLWKNYSGADHIGGRPNIGSTWRTYCLTIFILIYSYLVINLKYTSPILYWSLAFIIKRGRRLTPLYNRDWTHVTM